MYGQPPSFRPDGSCRRVPQPQQQQQRQPVHMNPSFYPNPNFFIDPRFSPHLNPFITPIPFPTIHQQIPVHRFPVPPNSITSNFQTPPQQLNPVDKNNISKLPEVQKDLIGKLDKAVTRARHDLSSSNKNVSGWEVSQAALLTVKAESWESLGFQMQQVPSLNRLLQTEGKINTFIHCFVAVRNITSLYDLEVAICKSEGIERFEELELGPLIRHPLAMHYFSVTSEVTDVYRIGTQELITYLCDFVDAHKRKQLRVDSFLDFISQKQSVNAREKLCVRVQDIGLYVHHIKKGRQAEDTVVQACLERIKIRASQKSKKRPLFSAQKKQLDDNFSTISQRIKSFSSESTEFGGTHIRFMSSCSEDNDSEDTDEDDQDEKHIDSNYNLSLPKVGPDHLSSCPYPSVAEEMTRPGLKIEVAYSPSADAGGSRRNTYNEKPPRKRESETLSSTRSFHKLLKRQKFDRELESKGSDDQGVNGHLLSIKSQKLFVTTWKEACRGNNPEEMAEHDPMVMTPGAILLNADGLESQSNPSSNLVTSGMNATLDSVDFGAPHIMHFGQPNRYGGDKLFGQQEALLTGRLGELTAFKYFVRNLGNVPVNWVNEANETGLPYDIIINDENNKEYVEVKATKLKKKNWFLISMREWQYAIEKGEAFNIAHVIFSDTDMAKVTIYKNPAKLCQLGSIKLAVVVPKN